MRAFARFVRRRGWSQVAMLLVGVAAIFGGVLAALLGTSLGSLYVVVPLCLAGAAMIIVAFVCMFIGPADNESPNAESVAQVGLEVPPNTPVRLPEGVPPGTAVQITGSEDLEENDGRSGDDETPEP